MVERSGERPGASKLPLVGALTGAIRRATRAVPHAVLLPLSKVRFPETREPDLREQEVMAAMHIYSSRSGKVHVTRKGQS